MSRWIIQLIGERKVLLTSDRNKVVPVTQSKSVKSTFSSSFSYLILLFESVSLGRLHLVDVLQEVSHPDGRVELTRVIGRALPPTVAVGRASQ